MNSELKKSRDKIQPNEVVQARMLENILEYNKEASKMKSKNTSKARKFVIVPAAAAAVLAICLFGGNLLGGFNKGGEAESVANLFGIVAYAMDGSEIISSEDGEEALEVTAPEVLDKIKSAQDRTIKFEFIGDTIGNVDVSSSSAGKVTFRADENGNLSPIVLYPEELTEDFVITATAHFLDGTTETKTITIPAN